MQVLGTSQPLRLEFGTLDVGSEAPPGVSMCCLLLARGLPSRCYPCGLELRGKVRKDVTPVPAG